MTMTMQAVAAAVKTKVSENVIPAAVPAGKPVWGHGAAIIIIL